MHTLFGRFLFVSSLVLFASTAYAQDLQPKAGVAMDGDQSSISYKKETKYDFEADDIEGGTLKPTEENIANILHGRTRSLIRVRFDFVPELIKSVDDL